MVPLINYAWTVRRMNVILGWTYLEHRKSTEDIRFNKFTLYSNANHTKSDRIIKISAYIILYQKLIPRH